MKVCIWGFNGGMGRRYRSILEYLGHEWIGVEATVLVGEPKEADAVIIATPTDTHGGFIEHVKDWGVPVLCEKPLTKDLGELESLLGQCMQSQTLLSMVSQYDYLIDDGFQGETYYNYFRHGTDGLFWDCINIVKHARGQVTLRNDSPIWECKINGQKLNLVLMDRAYIEMIDHWLRDPEDTVDYDGIWKAHKKVQDLEAAWRRY